MKIKCLGCECEFTNLKDYRKHLESKHELGVSHIEAIVGFTVLREKKHGLLEPIENNRRKRKVIKILEDNQEIVKEKKLKKIDDYQDSSDEEEKTENPYKIKEFVKEFDGYSYVTNFKKKNEKKQKKKEEDKKEEDEKEEEEVSNKKTPKKKEKFIIVVEDGKMKGDMQKILREIFPVDKKKYLYLGSAKFDFTKEEISNEIVVPGFRGVTLNVINGLERIINRSEENSQGFASTCFLHKEVFSEYLQSKCKLTVLETLGKTYDLSELKVDIFCTDYESELQALAVFIDDLFQSLKVIVNKPQLMFEKIKFKNEKNEIIEPIKYNKEWDNEVSCFDLMSHIYTNKYEQFKEIIKTGEFIEFLKQKKLKNTATGFQFLKKIDFGMPFLSEGQHPKHALFYGTHMKVYGSNQEVTESLYDMKTLKPKKIYLGKFVLSSTKYDDLHKGKLNVTYIPSEHSMRHVSIGSTIGGEEELQFRGGHFSVSDLIVPIKLPKFDQKKYPAYYYKKYGLSQKNWLQFKKVFEKIRDESDVPTKEWFEQEMAILVGLILFHQSISSDYMLAKYPKLVNINVREQDKYSSVEVKKLVESKGSSGPATWLHQKTVFQTIVKDVEQNILDTSDFQKIITEALFRKIKSSKKKIEFNRLLGLVCSIVQESYPGASNRTNRLNIIQYVMENLDESNHKKSFEKKNKIELPGNILKIEGDGACLFRSISKKLKGDEKHHETIREKTVNHMEKYQEFFLPFIDESKDYFKKMRQTDTYGGDPELLALTMIYDISIDVYNPDGTLYASYKGKSNNSTKINLLYCNYLDPTNNDAVKNHFNLLE